MEDESNEYEGGKSQDLTTRYEYSPRSIALLTTFQCNAACSSCCNGCSPKITKRMTLDEMKYYIDECLRAYPLTIKELSLTGGECFLLGEDLDEIVRYGSERGLSVSLLTNGYWGHTYEAAEARISSLREAGLNECGFSVGEEHQKFIPKLNCRNAIVAAVNSGCKVEVRIEKYPDKKSNWFVDHLLNDLELADMVVKRKLLAFPLEWTNFNNGESCEQELSEQRLDPLSNGKQSNPCPQIGRKIYITPYGDVLPCCGLSSLRIPHLRLGNILKEPLEDVYGRIHRDVMKFTIRQDGGASILHSIYEATDVKFRSVDTPCDLCRELFCNPGIIPLLRALNGIPQETEKTLRTDLGQEMSERDRYLFEIAKKFANGEYCDYAPNDIGEAINKFDFQYNSIALPLKK